MAVTLNKMYVRTYERNVRHLAQQTDARLRPFVQEKSEGGDRHLWGRMAKRGNMVQKNGARVATPTNDSVWSNRVAVVSTYHDADSVEAEDINQVLINPKADIAVGLSNSARRQVDDLIIAAATGNALDEAGNNNAFPAGQEFGDYLSELDFAAVTAISEIFNSNDIDPSEPKVAIVGPKQARKLLHIVQATNREYIGQASALAGNGFVRNWMGFDWILSNRLLQPAGGQIDCLFMTRKAMGLTVNYDIRARVAEDPSISFAWRVYIALSMGAVRVEDEHIVRGKFKNTATVA